MTSEFENDLPDARLDESFDGIYTLHVAKKICLDKQVQGNYKLIMSVRLMPDSVLILTHVPNSFLL